MQFNDLRLPVCFGFDNIGFDATGLIKYDSPRARSFFSERKGENSSWNPEALQREAVSILYDMLGSHMDVQYSSKLLSNFGTNFSTWNFDATIRDFGDNIDSEQSPRNWFWWTVSHGHHEDDFGRHYIAKRLLTLFHNQLDFQDAFLMRLWIGRDFVRSAC